MVKNGSLLQIFGLLLVLVVGYSLLVGGSCFGSGGTDNGDDGLGVTTGGDGDGDADADEESGTDPLGSAVINGFATEGFASGSTVTVNRVDLDGVVGDEVGATLTAPDGSFELAFGSTTGTLLVTVTDESGATATGIVAHAAFHDNADSLALDEASSEVADSVLFQMSQGVDVDTALENASE